MASSPRTWGCFWQHQSVLAGYQVFPTHVGVFLLCLVASIAECRLPHARGGVSRKQLLDYSRTESSPRTWGCFSPRRSVAQFLMVFPTHVGVFPGQAE